VRDLLDRAKHLSIHAIARSPSWSATNIRSGHVNLLVSRFYEAPQADEPKGG
jgi:hypothetical protein